MRERVNASFVIAGPITGEQTRALEELLGAQLDIADTSVTTWARPSANPKQTSDGVAISGIVDAEDEFDALVKYGCAVRAVLDVIGWRRNVARLDTEVVRVELGVTVDALDYEGAGA